MPEFGSQAQSQFGLFIQRLSIAQKLILGGMVIAAIIGVVALVSYVNRPSLGTLYANLSSADASKIVEKMKERNIPYSLEDGGKTVLAPKDQIYDLRLSLAGEGLPQTGTVGYELFDRTNLGVSDFVQKVNYRRAMEGELGRTILQLDEVEGARVHIVVPQRALFKDDEKPATASVVLKLKSGKPMKRETVQGIVHLVASSVEGLDAANVTIVDSRGILLSENSKGNTLASLTSTQYEIQQKVENHLAEKARAMLEGVVGIGNAVVQVSAELDFRKVERTLEQYDPDKTVVRSEQSSEEKNVTKESVPPSSRSNIVTNYEINKSVEHIVESIGGVKRLSVAAMVNGVQTTSTNEQGAQVAAYSPRKPEEMTQLTELVKRAVGFNALRNDDVTVENLPFGNGVGNEELMYEESPLSDWKGLSEKLFILIAMIVGFVLLRSLVGRLRVDLATVGGGMRDNRSHSPIMATIEASQRKNQIGAGADSLTPEGADRISRRQQVSRYIHEKPEDAIRLLKVWLADA